MRAQHISNGNRTAPDNVGKAPKLNGRAANAPSVSHLRMLAVLDGSERSEAVVDYLLDLSRRGIRLDVILLNVQPQPSVWQARAPREDTPRERLSSFRGKRVVQSASRQLEPAGITATERIEVGDAVSTIVRCAAASSCSEIVMPVSPAGPTRRWLARHARLSVASIAAEVAQLSPIPVVIVNHRTGTGESSR